MQPLLALDMEEAKAWAFLIAGVGGAIAAILGVFINGIQGYLNSKKLDVAHAQREEAKVKAEESEVKIDKTLKNTNGKMHGMTKKLADLEAEVKSLKSQNTTLEKAAHDRGGKTPLRKVPRR